MHFCCILTTYANETKYFQMILITVVYEHACPILSTVSKVAKEAQKMAETTVATLNLDPKQEMGEIIPCPRLHRGLHPICKTWPNCQELRPRSGGIRVSIRIRA